MRSPTLSDSLSGMAFRTCSPTSAESAGFVLPVEHALGLAHRVGDVFMLALQIETKILPRAVIQRAARSRADEIEKNEGRKVGRKELSEISETVALDLLQRAFSSFSRINAYLYPQRGKMVVDTASPARAELIADFLRRSNPGILIEPFRTKLSPTVVMTKWVLGEIPDCLAIEDEADLVRDDEDRATVKYQHHPLVGSDVRDHISDGKRPTRMAMNFKDSASFVLTDKLRIKRFSLPDVARLGVREIENREDALDAEIALYSGEMELVIEAIEEAMGGAASGDLAA